MGFDFPICLFCFLPAFQGGFLFVRRALLFGGRAIWMECSFFPKVV